MQSWEQHLNDNTQQCNDLIRCRRKMTFSWCPQPPWMLYQVWDVICISGEASVSCDMWRYTFCLPSGRHMTRQAANVDFAYNTEMGGTLSKIQPWWNLTMYFWWMMSSRNFCNWRMYLTKKIKILQLSNYLDNIYNIKQANVIVLHILFCIQSFHKIQCWSSWVSCAICQNPSSGWATMAVKEDSAIYAECLLQYGNMECIKYWLHAYWCWSKLQILEQWVLLFLMKSCCKLNQFLSF